jgi:leucine-rich repeat and immunoglobulin-like domain-containing nogo receptor-interacting protein
LVKTFHAMINKVNFIDDHDKLIYEFECDKLDLCNLDYNSIDLSCFNKENIKTLNISRNKLRSLDNSSIEKFVNLEELILNNNPIGSIFYHQFESLAHLNRLIFSNCALRDIYKEGFYGLRSLTYLDLSNNSIENLYSDTFDSLINLSTLNLNWACNFLHLQRSLFKNLINLKHLEIRVQSLNETGVFEGPKSLNSLVLDLSECKSLTTNVFEHLEELISLTCSFNSQSSHIISSDNFSYLKSLRNLKLSKYGSTKRDHSSNTIENVKIEPIIGNNFFIYMI